MLLILNVGSLKCDGIMFIPNFVKIGQLVQKLRGRNTIHTVVISCSYMEGNRKCSGFECSQAVLGRPSSKGRLEKGKALGSAKIKGLEFYEQKKEID